MTIINDIYRLKQTLDLPAIVPRPPCPPRTYKKVFAYLNTALATTRQAEPPAPVTPKKSRLASAKETSNKPTLSKTRTPKSTAKRRTGAQRDEPEWLMTVIRTLCKALKTPAAAPHVFTGVSSILSAVKERENAAGTPSRKRARLLSAATATEATTITPLFEEERIPALIAVVTMYTLSALTSPPSAAEYILLRQTVVKTLLKSVPVIKSDETELIDNIETFMREAQKGWLEMEWYQNIQRVSDLESDSEDIGGDEGAGKEEGGPVTSKVSRRREKQKTNQLDNSAAPKRAFGTMMTDATDWLSDDRRADYHQWKANIIKRIEKLEKESQKA